MYNKNVKTNIESWDNMSNSKTYILNIHYKNWTNQLWFENEDNELMQKRFEEAIENLENLREMSSDCYDFQDRVIEYFKTLGFERVQK